MWTLFSNKVRVYLFHMLQEITADGFIEMMESEQAENEGKQTDGSQSNHDSHEEILLLKLFMYFLYFEPCFLLPVHL